MNEAELLFTGVLGCSRAELYLNKNTRLKKDHSRVIAAALKRRISGEPLQYILGSVEFMGLEFKVAPGVLIPRPETELLVEIALKFSALLKNQLGDFRILDLCTGSGCIAVSLAQQLPGAAVSAADISSEALQIARENSEFHHAEVDFLQGDLFSASGMSGRKFELIVCNPPYVADREIDYLQTELSFEPRLALEGGKDGLDFYRRIVKEASNFLSGAGYLVMEMGFGQSKAIEDILLKSTKFEIIEIDRDYNQIERIIVARRINL